MAGNECLDRCAAALDEGRAANAGNGILAVELQKNLVAHHGEVAVVRNQLFLQFNGEDTVAGIRGATLIKGRQHADTTLVANHIARGCQSREVFKAVLDGEAHGVFQGRIIVRPGAQKTDAKMMTQALLLSSAPRRTTSRSSRFLPTTCSAVMAPPPARSTRS